MIDFLAGFEKIKSGLGITSIIGNVNGVKWNNEYSLQRSKKIKRRYT